jgi:AAA family ATP:ADP antiporter
MEKSALFISRFFNLRPGDFGRGLPLFAYYLLIVTFYQMARVARVAIFLEHFKPVQQPYADISVALLAACIIAPYIRAGRRASLPNLQTGSLLFFSMNLVAFWWGLHFRNWPWLAAVFYVWVGICGILAWAQVWTLANFVWNTREAKRLFGLLGSGGIVGGIAAGFLARGIALRFGTDATLIFTAGLLFICGILVQIVWRQKRDAHDQSARTDVQEAPRNLMESFRLVRQSRHLQAIAGLMCLCSVVTTLGGWQLNAIAKAALVQKDALTAFLGNVQGYSGILALIVQLLITTKLLRRFGVGVALLVLPFALMGGAAAVLLSGSLWAAAALRASDGVFRYSIDTSAVQLLYLPVPAAIKVQVKSFIDTVIQKFGDGFAALTLLLFASRLQFTPQQISWVSLVLLGIWIVVALIARQQYVATLQANIQQVRIQPEQVSVPVLDESTTNIFAEKLNSPDPNEVIYALSLFEMGQQLRAHAAVRRLLNHPSPHVRKKVISILNTAGDISVTDRIAEMLRDNDLDVRTEALRYLSRHSEMDPLSYVDSLGDFADFSVRSAVVSFLMRAGDGSNPEAVRLILQSMIRDLADPSVAAQGANAIAHLGDLAVPALGEYLSSPDEPLQTRRQIPQILLSIGTPAAAAALAENLVQGDGELRSKVISCLNKLSEELGNLRLDKQVIESAMIAETMGHYRSYQILASQNGEADEATKQSMRDELERIFRLMKLLFPSLDLQNAYLGIQSSSPVTHANALEFLDNTLNAQLRTRLVPLIDSEVSFEERVQLADRFLGLSVRA